MPLPLKVSEAASSLDKVLQSGVTIAPVNTHFIVHRGFLKDQAIPSHQPQVTKTRLRLRLRGLSKV